jgi:hypothetical protein
MRAGEQRARFSLRLQAVMLCSVSLMMEGAAQKGIALRDAAAQQQVGPELLRILPPFCFCVCQKIYSARCW